MATVTLTDARVHVHFTPLERLFTGRTSHTVPVSAIVSADVDAEPIGRLRGARRGLTVSGFAKIGVWGVFGRTRTLAAVYRGTPALRLVFKGDEFAEILVSTADAQAVAAGIGLVTT